MHTVAPQVIVSKPDNATYTKEDFLNDVWVMRNGEYDPSTIINRCNLEEYKLSITWKGNNK